jgi:hypothetical protein
LLEFFLNLFIDVNFDCRVEVGRTIVHGLNPVPGFIREHVPHIMMNFNNSRSPVVSEEIRLDSDYPYPCKGLTGRTADFIRLLGS